MNRRIAVVSMTLMLVVATAACGGGGGKGAGPSKGFCARKPSSPKCH